VSQLSDIRMLSPHWSRPIRASWSEELPVQALECGVIILLSPPTTASSDALFHHTSFLSPAQSGPEYNGATLDVHSFRNLP
jgi:hypothetical protein